MFTKGSVFQGNLKIRKSVWFIAALASILALQQLWQKVVHHTVLSAPANPMQVRFDIQLARVLADGKPIGVDSSFLMHKDQIHFWSSQCAQGLKVHWYLQNQLMQVDSMQENGSCFLVLTTPNVRPGFWTVDVLSQDALLGSAAFTIREIP